MATDTIHYPPITPQPGFADIVRDDVTYTTGETHTTSDRVNGWFERLVIQSGLEMSPMMLLALCALSGLALGGAMFVFQENILSTTFATIIGLIVPVLVTMFLRSRRQSQILRQMPEMIGELARAARTGRSLEQCFEIVADDTPAPLGTEMRLCDRRMRMGISLPKAIEPLPERTGVVSLNVLVTALSVHHQTGGDLITVLERLQATIRDRITFLGRLKTATSASRATAILMLILPPAILMFFIIRDAEYFTNLMASGWGWWMTLAAVVLQLLGTIWVLRILQSSKRT
ncbi:type II secretion system F family protein [Thalassoroseus pseudoceratinae]|uniref:type II secretion system F family protein n=1 Tax=Thalassoroseus pseudoceratinae TaxID=2713176 RepID=UPI001420BF71|nr:type II secretion system F family protein [Thalassoroseus pseudoceratinae]